MSQLIPNEVPSGVIDGVNKVFTFINDIDYITTLNLDGAEYTNFIVDTNNKKVVTLVDAPIVAIYADYYALTSQSSVSTDCRLGDMLEEYYNLTGQNASTSTNFNRNRAVRKINSFSEKVWKGRVTSILDPQTIYRAGKLWFQEKDIGYRALGGGKLTNAFNLGDIVVETDTTYILPAGYVKIGADIIKYTSITATQLEGVSGQTTNHLTGDNISQLYELPVDFFKPIKVNQIIQESTGVQEIEIPLIEEGRQYRKYYNIIRFDDKILLELVGFRNNDQFKVHYEKEFVKVSDDSDLCPFPGDYGIDVIATIVAGEHLYQRSMPKGQEILNSGYTYLQNMYQEFTNEKRIVKQSIRAQSYGFRSIR